MFPPKKPGIFLINTSFGTGIAQRVTARTNSAGIRVIIQGRIKEPKKNSAHTGSRKVLLAEKAVKIKTPVVVVFGACTKKQAHGILYGISRNKLITLAKQKKK